MKSVIKKLSISITMFMSSICLCSCSNHEVSFDDSMVIVDRNNIYSMDIEEGQLVIKDKKSRDKKDRGLWYYNNLFFENETAYFTKTSTSKQMDVWIEKIEKNNFNVTRKKHTSIDTNCAVLTDEFYYVVNNFVTHLKIDVYDMNLELVQTIDFNYDGQSNLYPTDLLAVNGNIYMLCGVIPNTSAYGYTENYIFKLDSQFNILEQYNLGENQGSFFSFTHSNNKLYLTHSTSNIGADGMALGGNEINIFDLEQGVLLDERITLSTTFPFDIQYDEINNNLIISHGDNGPASNHIWTIYDLDTYTETIFPVDFFYFKVKCLFVPLSLRKKVRTITSYS